MRQSGQRGRAGGKGGDKKLDDFDDWVNQQRGGPESLQHKQSVAGSLLNNDAADLIVHEVDEG